MALKKRFEKREKINVVSSDDKRAPSLKLVKEQLNKELEQFDSVDSSQEQNDKKMLQKKLIVYRRINELYQEKNCDAAKLMKGIMEIVAEYLQAEGGSLWLNMQSKGVFVCQYAIGPDAQKIRGLEVPHGKGVLGWVGEKKRSTLIGNVDHDERSNHNFNKQAGVSTQSIMAAPLLYAGEVLGVIEIVDKNVEAGGDMFFTESDLRFLEDISAPAAMHIKTSMTLTDQAVLIQRFDKLKQLHELFSSTMDLQKLLSMVLDKAIELLHAEVGSVWLCAENGDGVECAIAEGPTKDKVIGIKIKSGVGIIGWVVQEKKPSMIADCSKDARFSSALDEKIQFVTRSMISSPLMVKGECIGAIQIINRQGGELFTDHDLDFLGLFASSAAMYIKNARLFASEKKAKELSALIGISKEITSTLDLDAVLMSIVNLSCDIIPYERAAVSTLKTGSENYQIRAISGVEVIADAEDAGECEALHNVIMGQKKEVFVNSRDEYAKTSEALKEVLAYMEKKNLQSFWAYPLSDDQGALGILSMESAQANMIVDNKKEMLSLLVNQCTVALRNAELYTTIPNAKVLGHLKDSVMGSLAQMRSWPARRHAVVWGSLLTTILLLVFLKIPYNVDAKIEVMPVSTTYYSHSQGKVARVHVREGQQVKAGQLLAELDTRDLALEQGQKQSQHEKTKMQMLKARMDGDIANYKIHEKELLALDYELALLTRKMENSQLKAVADGVVVSEKLEELLGMPVNFGQELIRVAAADQVFVQFEVPEAEAAHVTSGQEVRFKVYGYPDTSFSSDFHLESVAGEGKPLTESSPDKYFLSRARVPASTEPEAPLRPGMTGRGKILTTWQPLGLVLFKTPLHFLMTKILF